MEQFSATEAKQNFGALLDMARREPVTINKSGRDVAVILAKEELDKLLEMAEDKYWKHLAKQNKADNDYLSNDESEDLLNKFLK